MCIANKTKPLWRYSCVITPPFQGYVYAFQANLSRSQSHTKISLLLFFHPAGSIIGYRELCMCLEPDIKLDFFFSKITTLLWVLFRNRLNPYPPYKNALQIHFSLLLPCISRYGKHSAPCPPGCIPYQFYNPGHVQYVSISIH